jgi:YHS domain-containing protein
MTRQSDLDSTAKQRICAVCNVLLQKQDVAAKIDHGAHAHHFCSDRCKEEFEKDPKKYH